jgi:hypothetical protein
MIRLGLVIAAIAVPLMPPLAEAAKCPSGQIYRVSKKTCQSKAIAIKLGIIKPARGSKRQQGKSRKIKTKQYNCQSCNPYQSCATSCHPRPAPRNHAIGQFSEICIAGAGQHETHTRSDTSRSHTQLHASCRPHRRHRSGGPCGTNKTDAHPHG